jgi:hypothetical protein
LEQETFRLLRESADLRIGVRRQGQEAGIEVLLRLSSTNEALRPATIRDRLDRLDALAENGYQLTAQDGWWVVCEKVVDERDLEHDGSFALDLFEDILPSP